MKHVLLSILMIFAIGISIPCSTVNAEANVNYYDYDAMATELDTPSALTNIQRKPSITLPTIKPLDVKRLYLRNYYKGLSKNFSYNALGSCSFVALGMMLSYYDSYLSDDIIPEQYDVVSVGSDKDLIGRNNSPGILFDFISYEEIMEHYRLEKVEEITVNNYYFSLLRKYGSSSLQLRLGDMAVSRKFLNLSSSYQKTFSINSSEAYDLLKYYLYEEGGFSKEDFELNRYTGEFTDEFKQYLKNNIDLGNPVYVTAYESVFTGDMPKGHAFVCYDYDSNDKFYAHMGWLSKPIDEPFLRFNQHIDAFAIDFKIEHTHSYNYMVGDKAYCYCNEEIETYHNHSYGPYLSISKKYHRAYCDCGKYTQSLHWFQASVSRTKCAACGADLDPNEPVIGIMSLSKTPNGSYISANGIPVIMEEDVEAYLNGTLKFGTGLGGSVVA